MTVADLPGVAADSLYGNTAFPNVDPNDATPENLILSFLEFAVEDSDRQQARTALSNGTIRQGMRRAEDFLQEDFDPMVHIAQLEDTQYAETLLNAANNGINKKMKNENCKRYSASCTKIYSSTGNDFDAFPPQSAEQEYT